MVQGIHYQVSTPILESILWTDKQFWYSLNLVRPEKFVLWVVEETEQRDIGSFQVQSADYIGHILSDEFTCWLFRSVHLRQSFQLAEV